MSNEIFMVVFAGVIFMFWLVNRLHKPSPNEQ